MENNDDFTENNPTLSSILGDLSEIEEIDLKELRNIVKPENLDIFDTINRAQKVKWAFLNKIPEEKLYALAEIAKGQTHIAIIHNLQNELLSIIIYTGQEKFKKAWNLIDGDDPQPSETSPSPVVPTSVAESDL